MKTPDDWTREYHELLAVVDEVRDELLRIPGVTKVSVGVKERGGGLTDQMAFRVYVREKVPESALAPEQLVPRTIRGYPTDVVVEHGRVLLLGFDDEHDEQNYDHKVGGIRIGNDKHLSTGTLGCFGWRNTDDKMVMISCYHVMVDGFPRTLTSAEVAAKNIKIGQPRHAASCCCACNEIGVVVAGEFGVNGELDYAIALIDDEVPRYDKIRRVLRPDGTDEQDGTISGSEAFVPGHEVWKIGATTGLTRGTVVDAAPDIRINPKVPEYPKVCDHGDSGSVVVDLASNKVVGLLKAMEKEDGILGFATPIAKVLTPTNIRILGDDLAWGVEVRESDSVMKLPAASPFAPIAERLRETPVGARALELVETHQAEVLELVNASRPGSVAWQRLQGPAFVAAFARSAKEPEYRIPKAIGGVSRERAFREMRAMLERLGSEVLRRDIDRYGTDLRDLFLRHHSLHAIVEAAEQTEVPVNTA